MVNIVALTIALVVGVPTGLGLAIKRMDYIEMNKKKDEIINELYIALKNRKTNH